MVSRLSDGGASKEQKGDAADPAWLCECLLCVLCTERCGARRELIWQNCGMAHDQKRGLAHDNQLQCF